MSPPPPRAESSAGGCGTLDGSYEAVRASVESVRSAQLGLALANCDGDLALGRVWWFHLSDQLGAEREWFLAALGVEPGPAPRRADPRGLAWPNGVLVTRDGAEDVAYMVRHLRDEALPPAREEFLRMCNAAFPALYDLKVMAEWATLNEDTATCIETWKSRCILYAFRFLREH
ncbi:hypothetical protein HU200_000492 [Digitaria exilis]|uniref:poly(A)-specific ribonuclease n=1 Tax=Digitaria exilis TaxID=1010633 RepID=A0A835KYD6_9POAL|nr:hypothetical protein HU200_000492 [Digitaria exilis]